ncbi:hypothetical protein HQ305_21280 [Rhodococcus sp. BP-149]|uniref:NADH-ubiquinone oxidoreductase-F iron-sulfur binding region domain-containing protein n=1 Tax=unclassified Rhodococcus (in: high G+C Gram-positive bacteria) TaxID=192944 RepID=UPI001C9A3038|nr:MULTISPECIES: NADH-ubiquinone oxidoreductase-F iron-sulfur binding region domain-containing protein [unclassified Rhodococcus (in: high G+C Gram-positive bacteria)]MBY6687804.1 hypothetical protein [Rhodococcus sp. BP-288]MBY6696069.1 hypothetical protein [Rhodococcus sp. BP-188]MBY6700666.1 hypothetical protein [Rhodococcus sp. BP-285]MBY6705063.1 hypothetical protein [Rhodococcus sp. BP-283]MBY6713791.1 hypothetical protein [Rhodococcus sp. BP-160]
MTLSTGTRLSGDVLVYPGIENRLVVDGDNDEDAVLYRTRGGYRPLTDATAFLADVSAAGVRGRGGATFPAAVKLSTVRAATGGSVVVANGEEGEPSSVKDRWLMRHRPHLVLDGLRLAAQVVGTTSAVVYLSDDLAARRIESALTELSNDTVFDLQVRIVKVSPTYVAGEETAAVRAINGGPALPTDKPPRPFEAGVDGVPTLINNVETLAHLALVHRLGVDGYRSVGTESSTGTFLMTLTTAAGAALYEVPFGVTLRDVLTWSGTDTDTVTGFLVGGYFAGVIGPHALDLPLDYDAYAAAGAGLGCGAMVVLDTDMCPVATSAAVMTYFSRENAAQCGSCFNGTSAMANVLESLRDAVADEAEVDRLKYWSTFLRGRGACGTLDGATNVAASLLREFPDVVDAHLRGACVRCADGHFPAYPPHGVQYAADHT